MKRSALEIQAQILAEKILVFDRCYSLSMIAPDSIKQWEGIRKQANDISKGKIL